MSALASPVHALPAPDSPLSEADYLVALRHTLVTLQHSLFAQHEQAIHREEELQDKIRQQELKIEELKREKETMASSGHQLQVQLEQSLRFTKRFEVREKLLSNRMEQLKKTVEEREAVIKYLEEKAATRHHKPSLVE